MSTKLQQSQLLQIEFLDKAAHLLSRTDPSTSSFLGSHQVCLLSRELLQIPPEVSEKICTRCGTLFVQGQTADFIELSQEGKSDNLSALKVKQPGKTRKTTSKSRVCFICQSVTRLHPAPAPNAKAFPQPNPRPSAITNSSPAEQQSITKLAEKSNSKQRAKARKSREGLQALLKQSRQTVASTSSSLDLMDLMKAGP